MSVSNVDDAMISFTDINLVSMHPPCRILNNVTGYVVKGGITALMGASGSGKTLLMRALCGRSYGVNVTGSVSLKGTIINPVKPNNIGFVPQEDILIGELTVRETFRISARLRLPESDDVIESEINELIKGLGLEHVADNVIGTVLKRGLSGGEKRRVSAGVELAARPSVIFLDEPTSGLDASSAFVVMKSIKQLAKNSGGRLCVMASMHQPNSRLLYLFDHLLMLGRGGMVYFGPVSHSVDYFTSLGFPCPSRTTPTDFFLHLIDQRFGSASDTIAVTNEASIHTDSVANMTHYNIPVKPQPSTSSPDINNKYDGSSPAIELQPILQLQQQPPKQAYTTSDISLVQEARNFDFGIMYQMSDIAARARHIINVGESREMNWVDGDGPVYKTSWFRQLTVLTHRNWMVAQRDLTLYWLQFVLNTFYGFMVGAEFFQLPTDIGARLQDYTNGIVWLVFVGTYLHVFKVYYLMVMKERYHHEHANQSYATSAWSLADLLVTSVWTFTMFIPGLLIAYFMMGLPSAAVGYVIFVLFLVAMTAESLMDLLCQFSSYIPTSILIGQGSLVVWCVFAGGAFIRWQKIGFWIWLSETSLYTWSTRGIMIRVFKHITYSCMPESIQSNGQCAFNGLNYPCDAVYDSTNSVCQVRGSTVLYVYKGVSSSNEWFEAGILIVLLASFRILTYFLLRYPWIRIRTNVVYFIHRSGLSAHILQQEVQISSLAARLQVLERQVRVSQQPSIQIPRQPILGPGLNIQCVQQEMNTLVNDDQRVTFHESRSSTSLDRPTITSAEFHQSDIKTATKSRSFRWNSSACALTWQRLRLELAGSGKMLVDDLYGQAQPGRVLAIMGPSGAGKTTMLNALSGRAPYAKVMGTVLIGSEPLSKDHLDYVPQFDVLNPALTVKQSFCIMAKLKNTDVECDKRVAELLIILGLLPHGDSQIRQLSSGDRKRVSIGLALISNPAVLFLDEPTTGLDSEAALVVVEYLIKVTRSTGVICCMTIHQPSAQIFNQLDDLLLLTGGQTAYFGEASKAGNYFTSIGFPVPNNTNPSDFYLDLVYAKSMDQIRTLIRSSVNNGDDEDQERVSVAVIDESKQPVDSLPGVSDDQNKVPDWKQKYLSSQYSLDTEALAHYVSTSSPPAQSHRPSEWQRLMVLVPSKMLYYWRERAIYLYRLIQLILLAIFIGTLFYRQSLSVSNLNEIAGAMFFSVWVVLFAAIGATPVLVRDRFCFDNEYLNGAYQISTYCLAVFVAALPYHIVTAVVYQTIVWYLVGFNDNAEAWTFSVLSTLALLLLMEGVSMVVVEFLPNAMLSTTFTMVVLGMFFLFPGFFIKVSDMVKSIAWLSWIMPTKYSLDSQLENIFHGQSYRVSGTTTISGDDITSQVFKLDGRPKWADWVIVMGYMLFFRVVHYVVVRAHYAKFAVKIDAGSTAHMERASVVGA